MLGTTAALCEFFMMRISLTLPSLQDKPSKPEIKDFLSKQFKTADFDGSGSLDGSEFKGLLQKLGMGVTGEQAMDLLRMADSDGTGGVEYDEFVETVPILLMQVMLEEVEDFDVDWVEVVEEGDGNSAVSKVKPRSYWYNKRTGTSQTQKPIHPDITEYLSRKVKAANYTTRTATQGAQYIDTKATAKKEANAREAAARKPLVNKKGPAFHDELATASNGAKQKSSMHKTESESSTAGSAGAVPSASRILPMPVTSAWANELIRDPAAIEFYCVEQTAAALVIAVQELGLDLGLAHHKDVLMAVEAEEQKKHMAQQTKNHPGGAKKGSAVTRYPIRRMLNSDADINRALAAHLTTCMLSENDGSLGWSAMCVELPQLLSTLLLTHSEESFEKDWVHLVSGPMDFYYNKRTMQKQQAKPRMPTIADYLMMCFKKADRDCSGSLGSDELWELVDTMDLNLSMHELKILREEMDNDGDGTVSWREFIEALPVLLRKANDRASSNDKVDGDDVDDAAWIELPHTNHSGAFYRNY
jgi:Ca2+-binding EF-hand superfamily protein